jgi:hypothetical protein
MRRWFKLGEQQENTLAEMMRYLSTPERKVSSAEFQEFWKSCTEEEKAEFKRAELK